MPPMEVVPEMADHSQRQQGQYSGFESVVIAIEVRSQAGLLHYYSMIIQYPLPPEKIQIQIQHARIILLSHIPHLLTRLSSLKLSQSLARRLSNLDLNTTRTPSTWCRDSGCRRARCRRAQLACAGMLLLEEGHSPSFKSYDGRYGVEDGLYCVCVF